MTDQLELPIDKSFLRRCPSGWLAMSRDERGSYAEDRFIDEAASFGSFDVFRPVGPISKTCPVDFVIRDRKSSRLVPGLPVDVKGVQAYGRPLPNWSGQINKAPLIAKYHYQEDAFSYTFPLGSIFRKWHSDKSLSMVVPLDEVWKEWSLMTSFIRLAKERGFSQSVNIHGHFDAVWRLVEMDAPEEVRFFLAGLKERIDEEVFSEMKTGDCLFDLAKSLLEVDIDHEYLRGGGPFVY